MTRMLGAPCLEDHRSDDSRQGQDGADRQVDAPSDDDEQLTQGEH